PELNLRLRVRARAAQAYDRTLAELGMPHARADPKLQRAHCHRRSQAARNQGRGTVAATERIATPKRTTPCMLLRLHRRTSVARRQPFQMLLGNLIQKARA